MLVAAFAAICFKGVGMTVASACFFADVSVAGIAELGIVAAG